LQIWRDGEGGRRGKTVEARKQNGAKTDTCA
jgi:hypothetical protein